MMHAAEEDWSRVQPAIFGSLFQSSMDQKARHAFGAHFTSEADIQKVILPTIVRPFGSRIEAATSLEEPNSLREELRSFRVLDPACGSGNVLYVAYRDFARLEMDIITRTAVKYGKEAIGNIADTVLSTRNFFGIDRVPFAAELAKVTLVLAKELSILEARDRLKDKNIFFNAIEQALPLDNLDSNVACQDALFVEWPKVDAIVGNPPFQSKNKMQQESGRAYLNEVRDRYPEVPGRADYCVYWFRRAHNELGDMKRAGLVGTNTIRQTYSREGGLDYILGHNGTITEAVASQVWSGDAVVHVSIVNWIKGSSKGTKRLFLQVGNQASNPWEIYQLPEINSSLSHTTDVSQARPLHENRKPKRCFRVQTQGHEAFLLDRADAEGQIAKHSEYAEILFPYLRLTICWATRIRSHPGT